MVLSSDIIRYECLWLGWSWRDAVVHSNFELCTEELYSTSVQTHQSSKNLTMSQFSIEADDQSNYEIFRDCVSGPIIQKLLIAQPKPLKRKAVRRRKISTKLSATDDWSAENEADDLADFIDVSFCIL